MSLYLLNYEGTNPETLLKSKGSEAYMGIPLTVEYIHLINEKTALALHGGYEAQFLRPATYEHTSERAIEPNGLVLLTSDFGIDTYQHGANIGAGLYHRLGRKLMKFELNYHLHFTKMGYEYLDAMALPNHPDISAKNTWKGNRLEARLTFYLFNKKSK